MRSFDGEESSKDYDRRHEGTDRQRLTRAWSVDICYSCYYFLLCLTNIMLVPCINFIYMKVYMVE